MLKFVNFPARTKHMSLLSLNQDHSHLFVVRAWGPIRASACQRLDRSHWRDKNRFWILIPHAERSLFQFGFAARSSGPLSGSLTVSERALDCSSGIQRASISIRYIQCPSGETLYNRCNKSPAAVTKGIAMLQRTLSRRCPVDCTHGRRSPTCPPTQVDRFAHRVPSRRAARASPPI